MGLYRVGEARRGKKTNPHHGPWLVVCSNKCGTVRSSRLKKGRWWAVKRSEREPPPGAQQVQCGSSLVLPGWWSLKRAKGKGIRKDVSGDDPCLANPSRFPKGPRKCKVCFSEKSQGARSPKEPGELLTVACMK